jgi:Ca2+-binding EF-hand superfamily protein
MSADSIPRFRAPANGSSRRTNARRQFDREVLHLALLDFVTSLPKPAQVWDAFARHANNVEDTESATLTLAGFQGATTDILADRDGAACDHPVFTKAAFDRYATDGCSPLVPLFSYVAKKLLLLKLRCQLELCASAGSAVAVPRALQTEAVQFSGLAGSHLNQQDFEAFLDGILPHLRLARDCPPWFVPYYMAHCTTRIFACLDERKTRTMAADRFLVSDVLNELLLFYEVDTSDTMPPFAVGAAVEIPATLCADEAPNEPLAVDADTPMVHGVVVEAVGKDDASYNVAVHDEKVVCAPRELMFLCSLPALFEKSVSLYEGMAGTNEANWFSPVSALRVYMHFCGLDKDNDGMLSDDELREYNNRSFTAIAVQRVFEEHAGGDLMDYKQFLEFAHASEYPACRSSMRYMWRILDMHSTGSHVHISVLRLFAQEVSMQLAQEGLMFLSAESIITEVVDMINPTDVDGISWDDVVKSQQGGVALPLLLDYRFFYNYDSREHRLASQAARE